MIKMSLSRLACLPAEKIHEFYRNPGLENKFRGIQKTVLEAGASTDRFLCMTNMVVHARREYYITFDEVIVAEGVAYCVTRKTVRKGSNPVHLEKSKAQVGLLCAFFEKSAKRLYTVKRLIDYGYKKKMIDLSGYPIVYVLDYGGDLYDIVANEQECLEWADSKMAAVDDECKAVAFDSMPFPEPHSWEVHDERSLILSHVD